MQSFDIRTWSCSCGYKQDFEPTPENTDRHFNADRKYPIVNLPAGDCPSCALKGKQGTLRKETKPEKKIKMRFYEQADLDGIAAEMESKTENVKDNGVTRPETSKEKADRIKEFRAKHKAKTPSELAALREKYEDKE